MSEGYLELRLREARLRKFGLALGLVLALVGHGALLWGPQVRYQPVLERAPLRRTLVVRPYRPAPPPPPPAPPRERPPGQGIPQASAPEQPAPAPRSAAASAQAASTPQPPARPAPVDRPAAGAVALPAPRDRGKASPERPYLDREAAAVAPEADSWNQLLAQLEARGEGLDAAAQARAAALAAAAEGRIAGAAAGAGGRGAEDEDEPRDALLDPRIRITVVSYPPTSVEQIPPTITYPDLEVRRSRMAAGICRVYYRIWVDEHGRVEGTRLVAPERGEERVRYAPFVDAVVRAVADWSFDRQAAEVHLDVLFEIE